MKIKDDYIPNSIDEFIKPNFTPAVPKEMTIYENSLPASIATSIFHERWHSYESLGVNTMEHTVANKNRVWKETGPIIIEEVQEEIDQGARSLEDISVERMKVINHLFHAVYTQS